MIAKRLETAALALALAGAACGQDGSRDGSLSEGAGESPRVQRAALGEGAPASTSMLPWGPAALGFQPGVTEGAALGVPAVAVGRGGLYLLDALHGRIVKVSGETMTEVARVPVDADDLAVGPDGSLAVRRSVKREVIVFAADGAPAGVVDTSALETTSTISLGRSRQVYAQNGFQETFAFGSPSMPQVAGQVLAGKREGSAFLPSGDGLVTIHTERGELELRVVQAFGREDTRRAGATKTIALGKGSSARVVGTSGDVACLRLETVTQDSAGGLSTSREAACVDVRSGQTLLRTALPAVGPYVPHRELAFAGQTLAFVRPTAAGLEVTTWKVAGGSR